MDGMILEAAPSDLATLSASLAEGAAAHDRSATVPRGNLALLRQAGLFALTVPAASGGGEAPLALLSDTVGRVAEGNPASALILAMQLLQVAAIARSPHWPEALRRTVFHGAVAEGALLNALRVEPELGTPARGGLPASIARQEGGSWRIDGTKIYSTGSSVLRWGMVWVRTDEAEPRVGSILVPMDSPGISIEPSWNQLGMRATDSHTVRLDGVRVPLDHAVDLRLPAEWRVTDPVHAVWGHVLIASLYDGVARAAHRWLVGFLRERAPSNLGATLASLPRFQELVGEIDALLLGNRLTLAGAIAAEANGTLGPAEGGLVKQLVTEAAIRAVEKALAATGNPGLSRDNPLERHYRDVLCARVHTPQGDAALTASGRLSLGV